MHSHHLKPEGAFSTFLETYLKIFPLHYLSCESHSKAKICTVALKAKDSGVAPNAQAKLCEIAAHQ